MLDLKQLLETAYQKFEEGTVVDLGLAPTGHLKQKDTIDDTMHSLCAHDIDEEHNYDDGW